MEKRIVPTRPFWYSDVFVFPKLITVITTLDEQGRLNAAPYSYIMQYDVMSKNPRIILGFRNTADTFRNIEATGEFVVNCPSADYLEDMMETARLYPRGMCELDNTRFTTVPSKKVKPPSIKECKQIIECTVDKIYCHDKVQGQVIANIEALVFDEDIIAADREERLRLLNLPVGLGDERRSHYYFTSTHDVQMFELEDAPADETQMSEDDIEVINYALDWEPAALEALEAVPKPVLSLVVTATEEAVRNDGETLVTLKRFQELSEEYAPPEVLNHFSEPTDDSESITDSDGMRWMGSSHAMYEQAIAGTPRPFRSKTKKKLYEALEGRTQQDEVITEDMLIECVEEITPAGFAGLATKRLEPMRTKRGTP